MDLTGSCPPGKAVFDPLRGEVVCVENGLVIQERVPYEVFYGEVSQDWGEEARGYPPNTDPLTYRRKGAKPRFRWWHRAGLKDKVVELYESGLTQKQIAEKLGIPVHVVKYYLRGRRKYRRQLTEDLRKEVVRQYLRGVKIANLSKRLGISVSSIYKILAEEGIKRKRKRGRRKRRKKVNA